MLNHGISTQLPGQRIADDRKFTIYCVNVVDIILEQAVFAMKKRVRAELLR